LLGGAAVVAVWTAASRVAGFARWLVFSQTVGSTATGSAHTAANTLPNILFEVAAGGALAAMVVPLLAAPLRRADVRRAGEICSALATWALTVLVPAAALFAWAAGPLTRAVGIGGLDAADPGTAELAAQLGAMFAAQLPLYGIGLVAAGALQAAGRFAWPALAPLLSSITVIGVYFVFGALADGRQANPEQLGGAAVAVLGWGTTAGVAVLTLPLLIPARRLGFRLRWTYRFPAGVGRRARRLAASGVAALAAQQLSVLVVVLIANARGGAGALPSYHYAQAVYLLPYAVMVAPLVTAAFPRLAGATTHDGELAARTRVTTRAVLAAGASGAAVLVGASGGVEAVFAAIDRSGGAPGLAGEVVAFATGLVGFALLTQCQRVLYAAERPGAALAVTSAAYVALIAAAVTLTAGGGAQAMERTLAALGAASSVGMTVGGVAGLVAVRHALGRAGLAGLSRTAAVALTGSAAGALAGWRLAAALNTGGLGHALAAAAVGAAVAAAVSLAAAAFGERALLRAVFARGAASSETPRRPAAPAPKSAVD
jgi:putative peptidoglycan lipid II flippase